MQDKSIFQSQPTNAELKEIEEQPILHLDSLHNPVIIKSIDLLRRKEAYLIRIHTIDGAEAIAAPDPDKLNDTFPIQLRLIIPFFLGKDSRHFLVLLPELLRHRSNYKFQGLALWVCVASVELAILELLGQLTGKSIAELFGGAVRDQVDVYRASSNRGNQPEEEIEVLRSFIEENGARAIKFRL